MFKRWLLLLFILPACAVPSYWSEHREIVASGMRKTECWYALSRGAIARHFAHWESAIGQVQLYCPQAAPAQSLPILFVVIHGTWARGTPEFEDDSHPEFKMVKRCAQQLARRRRLPVELVSFRWPGADSFEDRAFGGHMLAKILNYSYGPQHGYGGLYIVAHSHGCNVANVALQSTLFPADVLFYLASPVSEATEYAYRPFNFKELYNIYSVHDPVQVLGAHNWRSLRKLLAPKEPRMYEQQVGSKVVNIRIQIDGLDPGHIRIKRVAEHLWSIVDTINEYYRFHNDFIIDVSSRERRQRLFHADPLIVIREPLTLGDALSHINETLAGARTARTILGELTHSAYQEEEYAAAYRGKSIKRPFSWVDAVKESFFEMRCIMNEWFFSKPRRGKQGLPAQIE